MTTCSDTRKKPTQTMDSLNSLNTNRYTRRPISQIRLIRLTMFSQGACCNGLAVA